MKENVIQAYHLIIVGPINKTIKLSVRKIDTCLTKHCKLFITYHPAKLFINKISISIKQIMFHNSFQNFSKLHELQYIPF